MIRYYTRTLADDRVWAVIRYWVDKGIWEAYVSGRWIGVPDEVARHLTRLTWKGDMTMNDVTEAEAIAYGSTL